MESVALEKAGGDFAAAIGADDAGEDPNHGPHALGFGLLVAPVGGGGGLKPLSMKGGAHGVRA